MKQGCYTRHHFNTIQAMSLSTEDVLHAPCPLCETAESIELLSEPAVVVLAGVSVPVRRERFHCSACGESFSTAELHEHLEQAQRAALALS